jgi:hypothetical protein
VLHRPRPVAPPDTPELRSVVRLGLFAARTPEVPIGPVAGGKGVKWVDGDGADLPAPHSRVGWGIEGRAFGAARASVLRIPAPAAETYLLRLQALPAKQHPAPGRIAERLTDLASITGAVQGIGDRTGPLADGIAALMALPGVAEAQKALCSEEHETLARLFPQAARASVAAVDPVDPVTNDTSVEMEEDAGETDGLEDDTPPPAAALPDWFAEIHTGGSKIMR